MNFRTILKNVKAIAKDYGITINDNDFKLSCEGGRRFWLFTPYEGDSGAKFEYNGDANWWLINADNYTIRLMENDLDMFDRIAEYLSGKEVDNVLTVF